MSRPDVVVLAPARIAATSWSRSGPGNANSPTLSRPEVTRPRLADGATLPTVESIRMITHCPGRGRARGWGSAGGGVRLSGGGERLPAPAALPGRGVLGPDRAHQRFAAERARPRRRRGRARPAVGGAGRPRRCGRYLGRDDRGGPAAAGRRRSEPAVDR